MSTSIDRNRRPRLFVHIGTHKTGTTSIQNALDRNPHKLFELGYLYPTTGRHPVANVQHAILAWAFEPGQKGSGLYAVQGDINKDAVVGCLLNEIALVGHDKVIFSSEEFWTLSSEAVLAFSETFRDFDIEPILYYRPIPDYIESFFQAAVGAGAVDPMSDTPFWEWPSLQAVDYVAAAKRWAAVAHDGKIWAVPYDGQDSVAVMCDIVGIDAEDLYLPPNRVNQSLPPALSFLEREMLRYNIDKAHIKGLVKQLSALNFHERQSIMPRAIRDELARESEAQMMELRSASYVRIPAKIRISEPPPAPVHINSLVDLIFAIGRAVQHSKLKP